ncbi:MAG: TRAP transporter substrate-binding protein [Rhodospirillaceae bacterium]|jgi:TRAP-type transport system periplasmic protein|nr:TRAP transporter substrate-binding protein [Rhodospirillaceae bacterium]MBT5564664.1 TRAP transporter substrate-binding protein [Rhodospirillaceae bacterium]MBT6090999.1 TRAP transporter substrate-binding protein [Rhodospirillaceae bacterium]
MIGRPLCSALCVFFGLWLCSAEAASQDQPVEVRVGSFINPGSPSDVLFKDFAAALTEASDGALQPNLMIYGEAGSEEQALAAVRRGRIELASSSFLVVSSLIPEIEVTMAPFLFDSIEEYDFVLDRYLLDEFQTLVAEKDLTVLRWIEMGAQNFYGKKPIVTPEDVQDYRMRASSDTATRVIWEVLEADIIFLESSNLIPALQTGLLDGGAAVPLVFGGTGIAEYARHYTLSNHFYLGGLLVANRRWLESLPDHLKRIVVDSFASNAEIRTTFRALSKDVVEDSARAGVTVHQLSDTQRATWRKATEPAHKRLIEEMGGRSQQIYDVIQDGKRAYWAQKN